MINETASPLPRSEEGSCRREPRWWWCREGLDSMSLLHAILPSEVIRSMQYVKLLEQEGKGP